METEIIYGVPCKISYVVRGKRTKKAFTIATKYNGEITVVGRKNAIDLILSEVVDPKIPFDVWLEKHIEEEKRKQLEKGEQKKFRQLE